MNKKIAKKLKKKKKRVCQSEEMSKYLGEMWKDLGGTDLSDNGQFPV